MANQIWEALSKSTWTLSGIIERQTGGEIFLKVLFHLFFLIFQLLFMDQIDEVGAELQQVKGETSIVG
jgi:hypothetical protein